MGMGELLMASGRMQREHMAAATLFIIIFYVLCDAPEHVISATPGNFGSFNTLRDPKYKVMFHAPGSHISPEHGQETILMTDRDGQKYECLIPKQEELLIPNEESRKPNSSSIRIATDVQSSRKTPEDLLNVLNGTCSLRIEGWWTFELCYHGRFRQIHLENQKLVEEYILGSYDANATKTLHEKSADTFFQKDPRSQTAEQRYHAHVFTNGTICGLTNEPRQTEVRFVCSETGTALISSIKEAPTCKYTVIFQAPSLCKHPLFQEVQQPWIVIDCNQITKNEIASENAEVSKAEEGTGLVPLLEEPEVAKMDD